MLVAGVPSEAVSPSSSARVSAPVAADEPRSERPKRVASSSAQSTTARVGGGGCRGPRHRGQHAEAGVDAEDPVQPAAVGDAVAVAADQDRLGGGAGEDVP